MKLFYNTASPYARKARILVRETGFLSGVEEVLAIPVENLPDLVDANPLAQIPALVDDEGVRWTDSSLIAARLDALSGGKLSPQGEDLWAMRRVEVAASGLIEMLVKMVLEFRRPEQYQSPFWLKRWEDNLMRGFAVIDRDCPSPDTFDLAAYAGDRRDLYHLPLSAPRLAGCRAEGCGADRRTRKAAVFHRHISKIRA